MAARIRIAATQKTSLGVRNFSKPSRLTTKGRRTKKATATQNSSGSSPFDDRFFFTVLYFKEPVIYSVDDVLRARRSGERTGKCFRPGTWNRLHTPLSSLICSAFRLATMEYLE